LRQVLQKTLGVPLFQEQAMKISIVAAGFTPTEADQLRRAMATFRHVGKIHEFRDKMVEGMVSRGYDRGFAERCFRQIEGFGEYGFPESHAASFALLVYVSAWIKCHHPAVFACGLLNSQPMGFYAPAQIVRDACEHGVEVRPVDVNHSEYDCTLECDARGAPALRLGFRQVKGLAEKDALQLTAARGNGYFDVEALWRKGRLFPASLETLARADAMGSMGLKRREALWAVRGLPKGALPLFAAMGADEQGNEERVDLPEMPLGAEVVEDYEALHLSLKCHPMKLLRESFARDDALPATSLGEVAHGTRIRTAGLVLVRQRPGSANGVIFLTLEDETGVANIIVWPKTYERFRRTVLASRLLMVEGVLQREGIVIHTVSQTLIDCTDRLSWLLEEPLAPRTMRVESSPFSSRDFH
jgi:error-prone DNA polymerase